MSESSKKRTRTKAEVPAEKKKPRKVSAAKGRPRKKKITAVPELKDDVIAVSALTNKTPEKEARYFGGPSIQRFIEEKRFEIPSGYGDIRITLMVRDQQWLHAYWELPGWKVEEMTSLMGHETFRNSKKVVRVYDVTGIKFTGMNANRTFDISVGDASKSWYINTGAPDRSYCVDIGYLTPDGKFYVAARSNIVSTPPEGMSEVVDEEWITIDWERMYALSGGFGMGKSSGEIRELLKKRLREELSSGAFGSWSATIRPQEQQRGKDFWLTAHTELIVYGATDPAARVTVQGLPVKLRTDGTFTLRFALPDGKQEIPIVAVNKDGDMKRNITPFVEKRTK